MDEFNQPERRLFVECYEKSRALPSLDPENDIQDEIRPDIPNFFQFWKSIIGYPRPIPIRENGTMKFDDDNAEMQFSNDIEFSGKPSMKSIFELDKN